MALIMIALLWTLKPTRKVLRLPPSVAARVLATLEPITENTPAERADEIRAGAQEVLWECLRERGVPDGVYELVLGDPIAGHRIRRRTDGRSWSLPEFDDFIDLGLNLHGTPPSSN
jgi:hypothetical protein